jgi:hypothetical protein
MQQALTIAIDSAIVLELHRSWNIGLLEMLQQAGRFAIFRTMRPPLLILYDPLLILYRIVGESHLHLLKS